MTNQDKPVNAALEAVRDMMATDRFGGVEESPNAVPAPGSAPFERSRDAAAGKAVADGARSGDAPRRSPGRATVLEEMVMEQMTPMVQDWLDRHLPDIVAGVVEQEVRDLLGRRRG